MSYQHHVDNTSTTVVVSHLTHSVGAQTDGAQLVELGLHVGWDVEDLEVAAAQTALAVEALQQ
jgi:hypothetical protein